MTVRVPPVFRGDRSSIVSCLCLILTISAGDLFAQPRGEGPSEDTTRTEAQAGVYPGRLAVVGGIYLGGIAAIHVYQRDAWWKGRRWQNSH